MEEYPAIADYAGSSGSLEEVEKKLGEFDTRFRFSGERVVRSIGPDWDQVVLDIRVIGKREVYAILI